MNEPYAEDRISYIINLINPKPSDKVLNIGVSNIPEIEIEIENKVKECLTYDIDTKKMEKAQALLRKAKIEYGDVTKTDTLKKNHFDTAVILEVLEHLDDDVQAIKNIRDSLKKNGRIILSVPNRDPRHLINPVMYTQHKRHYSNENIISKLKNAGFEVEHFNVVESWNLLLNLYTHLIMKYVFRRNVKFNTFNSKGDRTYLQRNNHGLDIVISARKI